LLKIHLRKKKEIFSHEKDVGKKKKKKDFPMREKTLKKNI
tara:strand:+ start:1615 stop:1734 length:120 start_codon:yes stop_codon:yes gene_type:complete